MKFSTLAVAAFATSVLASPVPPPDVLDEINLDNTIADVAAVYNANHCSSACVFLSAILWGKVSREGSDKFVTSQTRLWTAQQQENIPACRVAVTNALDVSVTMLMLRTVQCPFAVQAGGHNPNKGHSNINNGVTIDLRNLNEVTIASDKKSVKIGPGNKWGAVYPKLDAAGIKVIGGRDSQVGVGGLMMGGGVSFFSASKGFASDNVRSYQVVFADGTIREVSQSTYPDLYKALRAGGNNFGIVTRFTVDAYPTQDLWGGAVRHMAAAGSLDAYIPALTALADRHEEDVNAAVIFSYIYLNPTRGDMWMTVTNLMNTAGIAFPPSLKNFTDFKTGEFFTSLRTAPLTSFTDELTASTVVGQRQVFHTFTYKNNAAVTKTLATLWNEEVAKLRNVAGLLPALSFQIISTATSSNFARNGGNAIGISPSDGPLILVNTAVTWTNKADDALVESTLASFNTRAKAAANAAGVMHPYVYLNYAQGNQDVFASYGAANKAFLKATHDKYDPKNVWTELLPGSFKI